MARSLMTLVGPATRRAIDLALKAELPPSSYKVLLVIVEQLTTFSLLTETVPRSAIAKATRMSEKQVSRAVAELVDVGAITWLPGSRGRASVVSIAHHCETSESPTNGADCGTPECPGTESNSGTFADRLRDNSAPIAGHLNVPPPVTSRNSQGQREPWERPRLDEFQAPEKAERFDPSRGLEDARSALAEARAS